MFGDLASEVVSEKLYLLQKSGNSKKIIVEI